MEKLLYLMPSRVKARPGLFVLRTPAEITSRVVAERLFQLVSVFWEAPHVELVLFDSVVEEVSFISLCFPTRGPTKMRCYLNRCMTPTTSESAAKSKPLSSEYSETPRPITRIPNLRLFVDEGACSENSSRISGVNTSTVLP